MNFTKRTLLFSPFLFLFSCGYYEKLEKGSTHVIVNQTTQSLPRVSITFHNREDIAFGGIDSLLAGPVASYDSVRIHTNPANMPTRSSNTIELKVWKSLTEPPINYSMISYGDSRFNSYRWTIQPDTILIQKLP